MSTQTAKAHKKTIIKFALLCAVLVGYFCYLSYQYDVMTGGLASLLTWSAFVLCTPVADAGFLLDFPVRLLFGVRMLWTEIGVWVLAITINVVALTYFPKYYDTTLLTRLLHKILVTPYPYWFLIVLSCLGTFLSIHFGDEVMDVVGEHQQKRPANHHIKRQLGLAVLFAIFFVGYYELARSIGVEL